MSFDAVALLGRAKEIAVVERFLAGAAVDGGGLLLTGPAGIGRTALLDVAVATAAASGALVVRAVGVQDEADLPFAGVSQLLAPLSGVERLGPDHRAVLLAVLGRTEHRDDGPTDRDGGGDDDADDHERRVDGDAVAAALAAVLEVAAAPRPVVVAVDDLDVMDRASADCLRSLVRRSSGRRIAVLATATTAAVDAALPECRLAPLDAAAGS